MQDLGCKKKKKNQICKEAEKYDPQPGREKQ